MPQMMGPFDRIYTTIKIYRSSHYQSNGVKTSSMTSLKFWRAVLCPWERINPIVLISPLETSGPQYWTTIDTSSSRVAGINGSTKGFIGSARRRLREFLYLHLSVQQYKPNCDCNFASKLMLLYQLIILDDRGHPHQYSWHGAVIDCNRENVWQGTVPMIS